VGFGGGGVEEREGGGGGGWGVWGGVVWGGVGGWGVGGGGWGEGGGGCGLASFSCLQTRLQGGSGDSFRDTAAQSGDRNRGKPGELKKGKASMSKSYLNVCDSINM